MLVLASSVCGLFKWRQFEPKVILLAVGWYVRFSLSYRDMTNNSRRVDETYVCVKLKGKWVYLYRAVDSSGATIHFLLSAKRDEAAAERFVAKALGGENHPAPRVINTDKHAGYTPAIVQLKAEGALKENCQHRAAQYLNNAPGTGSSGDRALDPGQSTFPLLLGSLAHNCRLRGRAHDPQRSGIRKCDGHLAFCCPVAQAVACSLINRSI
jgi:hypothetical protein